MFPTVGSRGGPGFYSNKWGYPGPVTIVQRTTGFSVANNTTAVITWDSAPLQDDVGSYQSNHQQLITPPGFSRARLSLYASWATDSAGFRRHAIRKNASIILTACADDLQGQTEAAGNTTTGWLAVTAGDIFDVTGLQTTGGSLAFAGTVANGTPWFQAEWAA